MPVHDAPVHFLDEFLRIGDAFAEHVHDLLVTFRVCVRHIVAQPDVAPLHDSVELRELAHYLRVEVEDAPVILTQLLDALRRNEAAAHQVLHRALRYPLGILHVALAAGQLPDEVRVDQLQAEVGLQHTPDGYPIHGRALHRHLGHTMRLHQATHVTQLKR